MVKKEATGTRPSALSPWFREKLGNNVAISDIDFVITSISNKDESSRYLIIEEKNTSNPEQLLLGLGQARTLVEMKESIVKLNIPIFAIFVVNENITNGVYLYELDSNHIKDPDNYTKMGGNTYVNVKKYATLYSEEDLVKKLLSTVNGSHN